MPKAPNLGVSKTTEFVRIHIVPQKGFYIPGGLYCPRKKMASMRIQGGAYYFIFCWWGYILWWGNSVMICNDISWYIHGSSFYNSQQLFIRSEAITTTLARASFCEQYFVGKQHLSMSTFVPTYVIRQRVAIWRQEYLVAHTALHTLGGLWKYCW